MVGLMVNKERGKLMFLPFFNLSHFQTTCSAADDVQQTEGNMRGSDVLSAGIRYDKTPLDYYKGPAKYSAEGTPRENKNITFSQKQMSSKVYSAIKKRGFNIEDTRDTRSW